jgi:hypothetical protein
MVTRAPWIKLLSRVERSTLEKKPMDLEISTKGGRPFSIWPSITTKGSPEAMFIFISFSQDWKREKHKRKTATLSILRALLFANFMVIKPGLSC